MELVCIRDLEGFLKLKDEWNSLLIRSTSESVYLTHEWLSAWWKGFAKDGGLLVLLAKEEGRIIGAAPLMSLKGRFRGLPIRKVVFMGDANWTVGDFIISENRVKVMEEMISRLYNEAWDLVDLQGIPDDSANLPVLEEKLKARGARFTAAPASVYPVLKIDAPWEEYYNSRSVRFKKAIRNKLNRIGRAGEVKVRRYSSPEEVSGALPIVFGIGLKGWKHTIKSSISSTEENRAFYTALSEAMSAKGLLDIWVLSLNGEAIAFEYHLRYNNRVYGLTADFDESRRDLSPGSVLDFHIVEHLFRNERCEYDMGSGASFYKEHWTGDGRESSRLSFYRGRLYGRMLLFVESTLVPLAREVRGRLKKVKESA
ncbi:MAG: GNAT family N-acetyltransferase [Deltaproteobacteria bacterium]|nr:GNAT family N-acetyltransferase [Deltaproteobacteria bacterium]